MSEEAFYYPGHAWTRRRGLERFSLAGRVVLVTGATRGLGLEIARGMAAAGAAVGINGRDAGARRRGRARAFRTPFPPPSTSPTCGARRRRSTRSWRGTAASIASSTTRPCATAGALQDIAAEDFRRLIETNLVAQYELSRVAARHMAARGQGRLVFISSMVGPQSFQGDPAYIASKGGLEALMRALAVELGAEGDRRQRDRARVLPDRRERAVLLPAARRRAGAAHPAAALRPARRARGGRHLPRLRRRVLHHGPGPDRGRGALGRAVATPHRGLRVVRDRALQNFTCQTGSVYPARAG